MCITPEQILEIVKPEFTKLREEFEASILKSHNEMASLLHRTSPETLCIIERMEEDKKKEHLRIKRELEKSEKEKAVAIEEIKENLKEHMEQEKPIWDIVHSMEKMVSLNGDSISNIDRALNGDPYMKTKGLIQQNNEMYELLIKTKGAGMWMGVIKIVGSFFVAIALGVVAFYSWVKN